MRKAFIYIAVLIECQELPAQMAMLRRDISAGDRPLVVVAGDFNRDSRPDLAVSSFSGLSVLLNRGDGTFARPVTLPGEIHPMFGPTPANYPVAADFNRDGLLDLAGTVDAVSPPLPPRRIIRLLLGRGDGTFDMREEGSGTVIATGDFNGDRVPDLVATEDDSAVILLGNGQGYFARGAVVDGAGFGTRAADFNRDGFTDLFSIWRGSLAVWLNRRDGSFGPPVQTPDASPGVVGDFNADGVPDIASGTEVLLGKGDGTFQAIRYIPSRRGFAMPFAAADFDGDGHMDLAGWVPTEDEGSFITVFRGKGDGTLSLPFEYLAAGQAAGQTATDVDGDGRPELLTTNFRSNILTVFAVRPPGPSLNRAVSAASGTAIVAPESLATLYVATGATGTQLAPAPYPTQLGGVSLQLRDSAGAVRAAPLLFVSPTQINFQVPAGTAAGETMLIISSSGGSSPAGSMQVDSVAPGLFMVSHGNSTPNASGVRVAANGSQTPVPVFNCVGPAGAPFYCGPAVIRVDGDPVYLTFYGTGFRGATAGSVTVSVNGVRLPVEYAGPEGTPGVEQIKVRLLPEAALIPNSFVTVEIDGATANTAMLQLAR